MAFSGSQTTRLSTIGTPGRLYGSFAGKSETVVATSFKKIGNLIARITVTDKLKADR